MPIWSKGDPVHLTSTAYGDLAAALVGKLNSTSGDKAASTTRKRMEIVVTRMHMPKKSALTPGWILGDCAGPQPAEEGQAAVLAMARAAEAAAVCRCGMLPGWCGTGVNRWKTY